MALGTEAELWPSFTQERFILLRGHGEPTAVTVLFLSAISHGNTSAEVHRVFLPLRVLNKFASAVVITETSVSVQCYARPQPYEFT